MSNQDLLNTLESRTELCRKQLASKCKEVSQAVNSEMTLVMADLASKVTELVKTFNRLAETANKMKETIEEEPELNDTGKYLVLVGTAEKVQRMYKQEEGRFNLVKFQKVGDKVMYSYNQDRTMYLEVEEARTLAASFLEDGWVWWQDGEEPELKPEAKKIVVLEKLKQVTITSFQGEVTVVDSEGNVNQYSVTKGREVYANLIEEGYQQVHPTIMDCKKVYNSLVKKGFTL